MYTNYALESKAVYDKTRKFQLLNAVEGYRHYIRFSFKELLPPKHILFKKSKFLLGIIDSLMNSIFDFRFKFLKIKKTDLYIFESTDKWTEDMEGFVKAFKEKELFSREKQEFEWIANYPWVKTDAETKEKSKKYLVIGSTSTLTSEYQILESNNPDGEFRYFQKRQRGLEYSISHFNDSFYVVTNKDKATNFKLMKTSDKSTTMENWVDLIPHRKDVLLEGIDIFKNFLVVEERSNGLNKIQIRPWDNSEAYYLPFESETYTAYTTSNVDFDTDVLRYGYQSLATPSSVIDFNMVTKEKTVLKEQEVLGGKFDKNNYTEERIWATAEDGTKIPISMVYRKGMKKNGSNPFLLYAYGSYGSTIDPYFSTTRLSLLDRGFIFAIAHVRGGEYLGREWYENGKLLKKKNTFTDFIDCSKYVIRKEYTSKSHLYAEGGSAGGLLMGAIVNMAPELYNGVIAQVPFVDVVTTMLDDSIPLTTGEYDEWGNPNDKEYYDYMLSYSPYDNVKEQGYPNMYVSTGLHDSQVQYWEPAKWVAKLRAKKTNNNLLFLDTNMEAGHGGASGRFEALKEVAKEFAFLLDLEKINK